MSKQYVLTGPPDSRSCPANFSRPYYSSLAQEITNHSTPSLMFLRRGAAAIKVGGFSVLQSFVSSEQNRAIARARVGKVLINNYFLIGSCSTLLTFVVCIIHSCEIAETIMGFLQLHDGITVNLTAVIFPLSYLSKRDKSSRRMRLNKFPDVGDKVELKRAQRLPVEVIVPPHPIAKQKIEVEGEIGTQRELAPIPDWVLGNQPGAEIENALVPGRESQRERSRGRP